MANPTIATNPDTGIRYYSQSGPGIREGQSVDLFVPLRGDTPTNPGGVEWPNLFGLPYEETGLSFYLKTPPKLRVEDEAIFFHRSTWSAVDYENPSPGGPAGTWEETLEVLRRPNEELFAQVEAIRLQANSRLYPGSEDPMLGLMLKEAVDRDNKQQASQEMVQLLARQQSIVNAGFANLERAKELRQQIINNQPFNLYEGWVNEV
jgi:hypothetical protein